MYINNLKRLQLDIRIRLLQTRNQKTHDILTLLRSSPSRVYYHKNTIKLHTNKLLKDESGSRSIIRRSTLGNKVPITHSILASHIS